MSYHIPKIDWFESEAWLMCNGFAKMNGAWCKQLQYSDYPDRTRVSFDDARLEGIRHVVMDVGQPALARQDEAICVRARTVFKTGKDGDSYEFEVCIGRWNQQMDEWEKYEGLDLWELLVKAIAEYEFE